MPSYEYTALNVTGKRVRDSVEASSLETAKNSLRGAGYTILDIKEQNVLNRDINIPFLGNPKAKDMAVFCRQFGSILRAGVSISAVLSMLAQQTENKKLAAALREMQADVEKGRSLAASMRRHPKVFNSMTVNMVAAGEESGNLEASFAQLEKYYEKSKKTKSAVSKAMIYPSVLIVVIIVVLIVMMGKIIPGFMKTFEDMGTELPALTRGVMAVSNWCAKWWWLLFVIIFGVVAFCMLFRRTNRGKHVFGWLALHTPMVKNLSVRSASATFCRTLSLLLASGLTLTDALELAAANMNNIYFREASQTVRTLVSEGWPLNSALRDVRLFPAMVCNMTGIGEESGDLQNMLSKTADYYDDEVEAATQKLLALLEPIIILIMAVFVVLIVFAIYLPMLNMTSAYDQYLCADFAMWM